jgi:biotin carboxyl carrier protein
MNSFGTIAELTLSASERSVLKPDGVAQLVAPMPGVIVICEKSVGEQVQKGDVILILEAMKMENLITAPISGEVLSILVNVGEKVGRGFVLGTIG